MKKTMRTLIVILVAIFILGTSVYATEGNGWSMDDTYGMVMINTKEGIADFYRNYPTYNGMPTLNTGVTQEDLNKYYTVRNYGEQQASTSDSGYAIVEYSEGQYEVIVSDPSRLQDAVNNYPNLNDKTQFRIISVDSNGNIVHYLPSETDTNISNALSNRGYYAVKNETTGNYDIIAKNAQGVENAVAKYGSDIVDRITTDPTASYSDTQAVVEAKKRASTNSSTTTATTNTTTTNTTTQNTTNVTKDDIAKKEKEIEALERASREAANNGDSTNAERLAREAVVKRQELEKMKQNYESSGQKDVDEAQEKVDQLQKDMINAKTDSERQEIAKKLAEAQNELKQAKQDAGIGGGVAAAGALGEIYNSSDTKLNSMGGLIIGVITFICYAAALIILLVKGVQFMMAAPEGKAEIKKQLIAYAIGAVIMFGIGTLVQIIGNFAQSYIG